MFVCINDDFDLNKIIESGQCFRPKYIEELGKYRFICNNKVLYINETSENNKYEVSCDSNEWESFWSDYFDLRRDYSLIRENLREEYFLKAALFARGIRILKQDKWETLISFIISQRKSIPAIRASVEKLCDMYGSEIKTEYEIVKAFPTVSELKNASFDELAKCGMGYRVPYIMDAVRAVNENRLILEKMSTLDNDNLFEELCSVKGVGTKVANCVMLFAYNRTDRAPVDVWIKRVIDEHFAGVNPFEYIGTDAGIIQQYVFYYVRFQK